jgi:hypothetical protein
MRKCEAVPVDLLLPSLCIALVIDRDGVVYLGSSRYNQHDGIRS